VGEGAVHDEATAHTSQSSSWEETFVRPHSVPVIVSRPHPEDSPSSSGNTTVGKGVVQPRKLSQPHDRFYNYVQPDSFDNSDKEEEDIGGSAIRVPMHDQRTVLISNLSDRTTHKDLAGIVRGGRVLDIFLRNDRSATVSFVEGAGESIDVATCVPPVMKSLGS
jgi:hypothetical protein